MILKLSLVNSWPHLFQTIYFPLVCHVTRFASACCIPLPKIWPEGASACACSEREADVRAAADAGGD